MDRLSSLISALCAEIRAGQADTGHPPAEVELILPVHVQWVESTQSAPGPAADLAAVLAALQRLGLPEHAPLPEGQAYTIAEELRQFHTRRAGAGADARRVLRDFCQRIMVLFWEALSPTKAQRHAAPQGGGTQQFDALTEALYALLQDRWAAAEQPEPELRVTIDPVRLQALPARAIGQLCIRTRRTES